MTKPNNHRKTMQTDDADEYLRVTSSLEHDNAECDNVQFPGYISAEN